MQSYRQTGLLVKAKILNYRSTYTKVSYISTGVPLSLIGQRLTYRWVTSSFMSILVSKWPWILAAPSISRVVFLPLAVSRLVIKVNFLLPPSGTRPYTKCCAKIRRVGRPSQLVHHILVLVAQLARAQGWKPWGQWFEPILKHISVIDNFKFFFKTILSNQSFSFVDGQTNKLKEDKLFIASGSLYYFCLHLRLASPFYLTQLVDMFSYETVLSLGSLPSALVGCVARRDHSSFSKSTASLVAYNFHSVGTENRVLIFSGDFSPSSKTTRAGFASPLFSIAELFYSANWLEREVSELCGVTFLGKKDLRNLMLQYGDSSSPFQKSFPTIGLKEMFYSSVRDVIVQSPVTLQV